MNKNTLKIWYYRLLLKRNHVIYWLEDRYDDFIRLTIRADELYWKAFFKMMDVMQ